MRLFREAHTACGEEHAWAAVIEEALVKRANLIFVTRDLEGKRWADVQ